MKTTAIKRISLTSFTVGMLAIGLLGLAQLASALEVGTTPPEIGANSLDGTRVSLASLRGKVVVVDFWASWCAPCKQEMPVLESLYKRFKDQGLVIVGVSVDNERSNAQKFARSVSVTFPIVHDADHAVADRFHPPKMPTSYVIDKAGKVRFVHAGYRAEDARKLEQEITSLLR